MRGALAAIGLLLRESAAIGLARFAGSRVPGAREVDADWLTRCLQHEFPCCRVDSVEVADAHDGTTDRALLRATYDRRGTGAVPPPAVFVKLAPRDLKTRLFVNLLQLGYTEALFYGDLGSSMPVDVPRAYHVDPGGPAQRFALVLEDVTARGARFTDVSHDLSLARAQMVVRELARLHAAFHGGQGIAPAWLCSASNRARRRLERFIGSLTIARGLRRFETIVPAELRGAVPRLLAARDALQSIWLQGGLTLIHGDTHAGNLYFLGDTVGFLDWQVVQIGQGMRDVSYFMITSVPSDLRRGAERDLIRLYLSYLAGAGAPAPSFDEAWKQYRAHAWYAWIATAVTAAATTLQREPIVRAGLSRSSCAIMDLGALDLL